MNGDRAAGALRVRYRDAAGAEYTVSAQDAVWVWFEDGVPVREIPSYPGQRHTPGRYWSATTGTLLRFESFLECRWLTFFDFDPDVVAIATQALELRSRDAAGSWRHVPDLFCRRADGRVEIVDVKNPKRLADAEVVLQAERTRQACGELGWDYRMVGALPPQRWANIAWLAGYRRPLAATAALTAPVLARAAAPIALGELVATAPGPQLLRPVVFHLLWCQLLLCDLDAPLRDYTHIRSASTTDTNRRHR